MRKIIVVLYLFCLTDPAKAQWLDSMKNLLASAKDDTTKWDLLGRLATYYTFSKPDSAIIYTQEEISLAKRNKSDFFLAGALTAYGTIFQITGNYPQAIYFLLEGLKAAERSQNFLQTGWCYNDLASIYIDVGDFDRALFYTNKEKSFAELRFKLSQDSVKKSDFKYLHNYAIANFTMIYNNLNQPDSAIKYLQILSENGFRDLIVHELFGATYFKKGDYFDALKYYKRGYQIAVSSPFHSVTMTNANGLAKTFLKLNKPDSAIFYANKVLEAGQVAQLAIAKLEALGLLAEIYKSKGETDSAVKYLELTLATKDSLFNQQKVMQMQSITFNEQLRQQDILEAQKAYQDRIKTYILIGGVIALVLIALLLFRNNRQKQKAKLKIEKAYEDLKSTQAQLIQSEKMASLGELTAGIAHEIQNPLNFVNNFSDVNKELLTELNEEIEKGDYDDAKAIAKDVIDNEEKINHHGKRADAIVKGMLQHSRQTSGTREPTDINALCGEYLRLAYHGMRAKDKSFNAGIKTELDETIGKINIIPQEIGRVLLNLFNNAFYAVNERRKAEGIRQKAENNQYVPTVTIVTKKMNGKAEIIVKDNGNGVPQNIIDKIFQPFFTTKPTGQGTGLGLSLAYDIIKAHGGEIKVETKEGEGSEFIIRLAA